MHETSRHSENIDNLFQALVDMAGQILWTATSDGLLIDTPAWCAYTGQSPKEVQGSGWLDVLHPDDRQRVDLVWERAVTSGLPYEAEFSIRRHDGLYRRFLVKAAPVKNPDGIIHEWVGICTDIEDRARAERLALGQTRILEMIAEGVVLDEILRGVVHLVEQQDEDTFCLILRTSADTTRLEHPTGARLPGVALHMLDSVPIRRDSIPNGATAFARQPLIVTDIAASPEAASMADLTSMLGLRSCSAMPILGSGDRLLGTFAMYSRRIGGPSTEHLDLLHGGTHLARVAIECHRGEQERHDLMQREERARARTARAEASFRSLAQAAPLSIVTLDTNGLVTSWNSAAERIFGWTEAEVLGKPAPTVPEEHRSASEEVRQHALDGDKVVGLERIRRTKDGRRIVLSMATAPYYDDHGAIAGTIVLADDITGRKMVEEENTRLLVSEREAREEAEAVRTRLRDLFKQAPAMIAVFRGPEHIYEVVSDVYVQMLGDRDFIGKRLLDVTPEFRGQGIVEILDEVYQTGRPFHASEMALGNRRGDTGRLEDAVFNFVVQPTRAGDGAIDGCMVHAVEVSEQVSARALAERVAVEREAVLGQITEGIVIADADGHVIYFNDAAQGIYGMRVLGRPIEEYARLFNLFTLEGDPLPPERLPLARAMRHREEGASEEFMVRRNDGREVVVHASASPVILEDGTCIGAVLTVRDITDAYNLDRQKDEFLSAAAHDLKTPLTTIKGYTQMLQRRLQRSGSREGSTLLEPLERIRSTSDRMTRLIDELLDVTRIQMGHPLRLNRQEVDLIALVREAVEQHPPSATQQHIEVRSILPTLEGTWDADRLGRVVNNLLSNAVKYSPEQGRITLTISVEDSGDGPRAVLRVRDEGMGIPAEDLPYIFDRFHRARNVLDRVPGAGIGLAAVKQIVEHHGGTIEAESDEGRGSTFTVRLPLA